MIDQRLQLRSVCFRTLLYRSIECLLFAAGSATIFGILRLGQQEEAAASIPRSALVTSLFVATGVFQGILMFITFVDVMGMLAGLMRARGPFVAVYTWSPERGHQYRVIMQSEIQELPSVLSPPAKEQQ